MDICLGRRDVNLGVKVAASPSIPTQGEILITVLHTIVFLLFPVSVFPAKLWGKGKKGGIPRFGSAARTKNCSGRVKQSPDRRQMPAGEPPVLNHGRASAFPDPRSWKHKGTSGNATARCHPPAKHPGVGGLWCRPPQGGIWSLPRYHWGWRG